MTNEYSTIPYFTYSILIGSQGLNVRTVQYMCNFVIIFFLDIKRGNTNHPVQLLYTVLYCTYCTNHPRFPTLAVGNDLRNVYFMVQQLFYEYD